MAMRGFTIDKEEGFLRYPEISAQVDDEDRHPFSIPDYHLRMLSTAEIRDALAAIEEEISHWRTIRSGLSADQQWFAEWMLGDCLANRQRLTRQLYRLTRPPPADAEVARLRAKAYPIQELLPDARRVGANRFVAICPFHDERNPSFTIYTEDNHAYCFSCSKSFDSIAVAMKIWDIPFYEAVKRLFG